MSSFPARREKMTYREKWAVDTARAGDERFAARVRTQEYVPFLRAAVEYEIEEGDCRAERVKQLNQRIIGLTATD